MFVRGKILQDSDGRLAELQQQARRRWDEAPLPWPLAARDQWRYDILDLLQDIEDVLAEDPDTAAYTMGLATQKIVEGYYRQNGWWEPKAKYVLADLATRHPEMAFQFRMIISGRQSLNARYQALQQLAETVQGPMGGYLTNWQTEPEPVEPWRNGEGEK
jgi:hypothetical protein